MRIEEVKICGGRENWRTRDGPLGSLIYEGGNQTNWKESDGPVKVGEGAQEATTRAKTALAVFLARSILVGFIALAGRRSNSFSSLHSPFSLVRFIDLFTLEREAVSRSTCLNTSTRVLRQMSKRLVNRRNERDQLVVPCFVCRCMLNRQGYFYFPIPCGEYPLVAPPCSSASVSRIG